MAERLLQVVNNSGKPAFEVTVGGKARVYTPEAIGALILGRMKDIAEQFFKRKVTRAVLAVPGAYRPTLCAPLRCHPSSLMYTHVCAQWSLTSNNVRRLTQRPHQWVSRRLQWCVSLAPCHTPFD